MNDIQYLIPTRGRSQVIERLTLTQLAKAGVPADQITVVCDDGEALAYRAAMDPGMFGSIVSAPKLMSGKGLRPKRNWTMRIFSPGTRLLSLDDDIKQIGFETDKTKYVARDITDLPRIAEWAFLQAEGMGLGLWGVSPTDNPYFMYNKTTSDLRYIEGALFGITLRGDDTELCEYDDKEDFERSVRFALRDGGVLRLNYCSIDSDYYAGAGGMVDYRTREGVSVAAHSLAEQYPKMVKFKDGSKTSRKFDEVRLNRFWSKPVADPFPAPEWMEDCATERETKR